MEKVDHTEGSIMKSIFRMGLPSMIGFAAGNIYDLADMFWVAKLGAEHVAAITIFSAFYWVVSAANQLAGTGSVALISRRYGEKDYHKTEAVIKETFILKWAIAIFFGTIGYFLVDKIMFILGARGEVIDLGISYGKIRFLGLGFALASFSVYTALRSVADPNKAMLVMIGYVRCLFSAGGFSLKWELKERLWLQSYLMPQHSWLDYSFSTEEKPTLNCIWLEK